MVRATKDREAPAEERSDLDDAWQEESGEPLHLRLPLDPPHHHFRPLPFGARVAVFIAGWVLILIGIAGLVLPGIQGIFTIILGAALLSLDNELMYRALRRVFRRWPKLWGKLEHFRARAHDRVHRMFHRPQ